MAKSLLGPKVRRRAAREKVPTSVMAVKSAKVPDLRATAFALRRRRPPASTLAISRLPLPVHLRVPEVKVQDTA